jgi:hypothetical protein
MQERRRSGRWQIDSQASVKIPGHAHPFYCTIEDINFKGARISFSQYMDMDNVLAMSIALENELSLNIEAAVAWNKVEGPDNVYGFSFTKIKDNDKENIYKFIQRNFAEKVREQVYGDLI